MCLWIVCCVLNAYFGLIFATAVPEYSYSLITHGVQFLGNYQGLCTNAKHPPGPFDSLTTRLMDFIYSSKYLYQVSEWLLTVHLQISVNTPCWGPPSYQRNTDISYVHVNIHRLWNYKYESEPDPQIWQIINLHTCGHTKAQPCSLSAGSCCGDCRYGRHALSQDFHLLTCVVN